MALPDARQPDRRSPGSNRQALAGLVPHIRSDDCPVCGRDFREVSPLSLSERVAAEIARLTGEAQRLQSLARARLDNRSSLAAAQRERELAMGARLSPDGRAALKARIADLSEQRRALRDLSEPAAAGANVLRNDAEATQQLAEARASEAPMSFKNSLRATPS